MQITKEMLLARREQYVTDKDAAAAHVYALSGAIQDIDFLLEVLNRPEAEA